MARKSPDALAKQKEARQKKLLIVLLPVFLLLMAWQGPGMLKAFTGGDAAPEAAPAETPEPATTGPALDPATGAPPTTAVDTAPVTAAAPAVLPETDVPVPAGTGQLVSFDRFVGKDPFKQQVVEKGDEGSGADASSGSNEPAAAEGSGTGDSGGSGSGSGGDPTAGPPDGGSDPDDGTRTSATVDVNGTRQGVFVASTFPSLDPIFRIVSIAPKSAKIELVTGRFSNGRTSLTLKLGKPLTLVSQPDGLRYVVTLVATGSKTG